MDYHDKIEKCCRYILATASSLQEIRDGRSIENLGGIGRYAARISKDIIIVNSHRFENGKFEYSYIYIIIILMKQKLPRKQF